MMTLRRFLLILAIILAPLSTAPFRAQEESPAFDEQADILFRRGISLYDAGRYQEAIGVFEVVIRDFPASHRATAAHVMRGKGFYRLREYLEAARSLRSFLAAYPTSTYVSDAHFTLGQAYERVGRVGDAFEQFRLAWRTMPIPPAPRQPTLVLAALDSLINRSVEVPALTRAVEEATSREERAFLWLKIGEKEAARQNIPAAARALDTLTKAYATVPLGSRLDALRGRVTKRSLTTIGLVLPLLRSSDPSAVKELGNDIRDGVVCAVEEYNADPSARVKVKLDIRDTERDGAKTAQEVEALAADPAVISIVGPVFSSEATAAAEAATRVGVSLMTPTANAVGIAAVGPTVFQANADYDMRGRAMARFAVQRRGYTTLAVLAPRDTYGMILADGFVREARALGARVVAVESYLRGDSDLKQQMKNLRRSGLQQESEAYVAFGGKMRRADMMRLVDVGVPIRRIDSLLAKGARVRATWLLGPRAKERLDSLEIPLDYDLGKVDSTGYPIRRIQAIYVPISQPSEIGVVTSQLVFFRIETQILGSGEWNDFGELSANRRYAEGVIFDSDVFIDSASVSYQEYLRSYASLFKKRPSKNTLYGYDAARLVLSGLRAGAGTREALSAYLRSIEDFRGLRSRIGFSQGRVNKWLSVLQFTEEGIRKIDEVAGE